MKILMATMELDIDGAETHVVELSKYLKNMGHDLVIVSNGGVYLEEVAKAGIRHYQAPLNRRSIVDMRKSYRILKEVIQKEKPDVVHAHARVPAFVCGILQKKMGFSFVTTCHGVSRAGGMMKLLSNWGERTLVMSEDIRNYLEQQYKIPRERIGLTINGIDTEKFSAKTPAERIKEEFGLGDGLVIGHVSRLDQDSSLAARQLIEIAPRLNKAVPGIQVLVVGDGDVYPELRDRAEQVNRELGRACLVLTGPRTDINELLAACNVFVGVSRAALEAMAAEKPVILSGAQGHTGLFRPDMFESARDTDFCCCTDSVVTEEILLQDILNVVNLSEEEQRNLGVYGRQVVFDHYSVRRMGRDILKVYEQVRKKKYHVVLSGYYGFDNAGDEAILESISQTLQADDDGVELTVLTNNPEATSQNYGLKSVHRAKILSVFRSIKACDMLLFGGGSLLQDRTSTRSILYYLSIIRVAKLMGKPVMLYANGIGPVEKSKNRTRVKRAVDQADMVTVRDRGSARELESMGIKNKDIHVTADPVFQLMPVSDARSIELLETVGLQPGTPFAVVSVREWQNTEAFSVELAAVCDYLRCTYNMEILFILMQPQKDRQAAQRVREAMKGPSYILDVPCSPKELMGVLGQGKLCLAMRLHALIFAARMAVPSLGLVYDPKVDSYLKELDMTSVGDVTAFDRKLAIEKVDKLMAEYDTYLERLKRKTGELSAAAQKNEQLLFELLKRNG